MTQLRIPLNDQLNVQLMVAEFLVSELQSLGDYIFKTSKKNKIENGSEKKLSNF